MFVLLFIVNFLSWFTFHFIFAGYDRQNYKIPELYNQNINVENYYRNHHAEVEIDRTILTCLNYRKNYPFQTYERTDPNYRKASLLKWKFQYICKNMNSMVPYQKLRERKKQNGRENKINYLLLFQHFISQCKVWIRCILPFTLCFRTNLV